MAPDPTDPALSFSPRSWQRGFPARNFRPPHGYPIADLEPIRTDLHLRSFLLFAAILLSITPAAAQAEAGARGEALTVYLMTMGPGAAVWEKFGHNAIWISDAETGTDVAYNYGMFSFEQENFLLRFIQGHMDYWMEGFDAGLTANAYIQQDRSVWAQELNLTPAQRADLRDYLEWNALPENRFYRYDYYRDNCSTRLRDAIDRVLGGQIQEQTAGVSAGTTYREHTRGLTAEDPLLYTGLMIGLAQPVDREISVWEEMFLPMELRRWARELTILQEDGSRVPLVRAEETVYLSAVESAVARGPVPSRFLGYLFGGLLIGTGIAISGWYAGRRRDVRMVFRILSGGYSLLGGLLGLVLVGLWAFTDHSVAFRNENILLLNPLLLALAYLLPAAAARPERHGRAAWILAAVIALISVAGVALKIVPGFVQENAEIVALLLPLNLSLALAAWFILRGGSPEGAAEPVRAQESLAAA